MPAAKPKTRTTTVYKNLGDVAENFAVGVDTVKRWRSEGMPGTAGKWVAKDISHWLRTDGPWRERNKLVVQPSDDPLLAGGDSPWLEQYRKMRAKHAELDLENRKGELIERDKCQEILSRWAVLIRRMGERLGKRYGNDAAATVKDTLDECRSVVMESVE